VLHIVLLLRVLRSSALYHIFCSVSHPTKSRQEAGTSQYRTRVWLGVRGGRHKLRHQSKSNLCTTLKKCHYCARCLIEPQVATTSIWHRACNTRVAAFAVVLLSRSAQWMTSSLLLLLLLRLYEMTHAA
jgi:hypothetical protein